MAADVAAPPPESDQTAIEGHRPAPAPAAPEAVVALPRTLANVEVRENWLVLSALVILGGVASIAYYLGFVQPYLLAEYYATPLLDLAKINGATNLAANWWGLTWLVVFGCYFLAFRLCPSAVGITRAYRWVALGIIVGWAGVFCLNLLFMYPVGAADIFDQLFRARITSVHGLNPFLTSPHSIVGDPLLEYVAWRDEGSTYGPVWELLAAGTSGIAHSLPGDVLWNNLISFKILVILAYAGSVALVYATLKAWRPDWALRGTLFFAWNPLVLFEVAGNGHNDAIVVFFLLLAVYLFVTMRRWAVIPTLMLGALTKFVPLLLVPIAIVAIWRDRWPHRGRARAITTAEVVQTLALSVGLVAGLAILIYTPFQAGIGSIGALNRFTASIPKVVLDWLILSVGVGEKQAQDLVRLGALGLVGISAAVLSLWVLLWGVRRVGLKGVLEGTIPPKDKPLPATGYPEIQQPEPDREDREVLVSRTLRAFYEIVFIVLAFSTIWFQPWYVLWLLALTAPLASYTHANRTMLFCVGVILHYFVWSFVWLWNQSPMQEIQALDVLIVYTPTLFYTLWVVLRGFAGRWTTGDGRRTMDDGR